ncbi:NADPH-dependent FMN reductase [Streptococcus halotolerans]|uniref:NADPH-dependent FMN reductase n=1 Tax=Streptococcus halotolerans TaxID=1814128 RepID=UPI000786B30D|nr:NADPH-dependent FMN reductase [Streptococcus halotolerans]
MKNILFVVGSLRQGSFNHQMAELAEKALEGKATVTYLNYSDVPVFSQDLEAAVPAAVAKAREAVQDSDAIWFFSPVYNFAMPGTVKNLLDWLSRSLDPANPAAESVLHDKVTTVSLVANGGHEQAGDQYRSLLPFIRTNLVDHFTTATVNDSAWVDGKFLATEEVLAALDKQIEALLAAINS